MSPPQHPLPDNRAASGPIAVAPVATSSEAIVPPPGACPACHAINTTEARFCTECGCSMSVCPACSGPVHGDVCEACGHWLLPGQCRFCYASLAEGAAFCEDCGGNRAGMACAGCGSVGFFDFCTGCGGAVTERGLAVMASPPDPALEAGLQAIRALQAELQELVSEEAHGAALAPSTPVKPARLISRQTLQGLRDTAASQERGASAADRAQQTDDAARAGAEVATQAAAQAACAEALARESRFDDLQKLQAKRLGISARLRAARERALALATASEGQRFTDGQQARCHMMALRQRLVVEGMVPRSWRCNAYGVEHEVPNDCGKPEDGGVWLF